MAGVRQQQRERTKRALVAAASTAFAERGFGATSLRSVVVEADVTKGAFYHHFESKEALFEAVVRNQQTEVAMAVSVAAGATTDGGWDSLLEGCRAYMSAATAPGRRQILLVDGPAVLGLSRWRQLDDEGPGRLLQQGLAELQAAGLLSDEPVEPLARLLSGAMNEAALWACDGDPGDRLQRADAALRHLIDGLRRLSEAPRPG